MTGIWFELHSAVRERCAYLIVIASIVDVGRCVNKMVATIVRRKSKLQILRDNKREQIDIYKTGIHTNPIVNEAIDKVEADSQGSGSGTATASTTIPILLKKRRELRQRGED